MTWQELFAFEIKYRLKRPETYLFFLVVFLFSMEGTDFVFGGIDLGQVKKNAPVVIAKTMGILSGLTMLLTSMIMGVPVLRDIEYNMASLLYVNPISKRDYLLGRFLGSFVILLFIFSGLVFGMAIGELMPWNNVSHLLPFKFYNYLYAFFTVAFPIILFGAVLFFITGSLSRKLIVVYTQGIVFFVVYMVVNSINNDAVRAVLDPFSLNTLKQVTLDWSIVELNMNRVPFKGYLFYNKLLWFVLTLLVVIFGYRKFHFNLLLTSSKKKEIKKRESFKLPDFNLSLDHPIIELRFGYKAWIIQLLHQSWFYCRVTIKQPSFWAIAICGVVIIMVNSVSLGTSYGVDSYPATYFIVEELKETSIVFFLIVLVFYSAELIWKERSAQLNLIYDSTPTSNFLNLLGKFISLLLVYTMLMGILIIAGILFQTLNGYYQYQLDVYFTGFFVELFPFLALYTLAAFFLHVLINRKFIGILATLVFFILNLVLELYGYKHGLYKFGGDTLGLYSAMNGYGHVLTPYLLIKTYWLFFGLLLLVLASVISVRGIETHLLKRWRARASHSSKPLQALTWSLSIGFVCLGAYIYYNTNIINTYWTKKDKLAFRAGYEQDLKSFEYINQPKITHVDLEVDLFPKKRQYSIHGTYTITNIQPEPITQVHIQKYLESEIELKDITILGGAKPNNTYNKYGYGIYQLNQPLIQGDTIVLEFVQTFIPVGFEEGSINTDVVENGTFFNNTTLPTFGYNRNYELNKPEERTLFQLPSRQNKSNRNNPLELVNARTGSDSKGITLDIVIGTDVDQTALAPGVLEREWKTKERRYFHYVSHQPIINFYSIISARYQVVRDQWQSKTNGQLVDLEIYYHPEHTYNLNRMMEGMKWSLTYYTTHFGPYQYPQMRIMEFPRYRKFAQSFPNTVPYSEALGFMLNINDSTDVDMAFYITAHELAHQWWGLQVETANVKGRNFVLETLSQYSAVMILQEKYGQAKTQQFLESRLEEYKEGRLKDKHPEVPLIHVENQDYIYYDKGAIAMYTLQKTIGADKVNQALRQFIKDWSSFNNPNKPEHYATSADLVCYFREVTPDSLQGVITELFETTKVGF